MSRIAKMTHSKCMKTGKVFNIRWEKIGDDSWEATWAHKLPLKMQGSKNDTGDDVIEGFFSFSPEYPGCPLCGGTIMVRCPNDRCMKIYCHDREKGLSSKCPWCGSEGTLIIPPEGKKPPQVKIKIGGTDSDTGAG